MASFSAFTLIELLVVIAIIAILTAILLPVFAQAREKARQTACLSSTKQLGTAVYQYYQDYDEVGPNGTYRFGTTGGWAGQIAPYVKNVLVFRCPSDVIDPLAGENPSSYAMNSNLSIGGNGQCTGTINGISGQCSQSFPISEMASPSRTVMFFEVQGNKDINIANFYEQPYNSTINWNSSPFGAGGLWEFSPAGGGSIASCPNPAGLKYATGYLGGRDPKPFNVDCTYSGPEGRHSGGSNYLMADTHAKWFKGSQVSAGSNAQAENAAQTGGQYNRAAGTAGTLPSGAQAGATFSIR
jgi:prepilin-type N-terminal cleavage/methylation domain-containing protein/prepilin-type processing-associated H-X9-DG protein